MRHVGVSNVSVEQLATARQIVPVVSVQNRYNIAGRHSEDVLQACERDGLGFIPWFPLDAGSLEGLREPLEQIARAHDATPFQIAIAWLLAHSPVMLPIPGTSSVAHLEENVAAAELRLTAEELALLER